MSNSNKDDLKAVLPLDFGCLLGIIGFHWGWWKEIMQLLGHDSIFTILYSVFFLAYIVFAVLAYIKRDDPDNTIRITVLVCAALLCIWLGMWGSERRVKTSENIEYQYKN